MTVTQPTAHAYRNVVTKTRTRTHTHNTPAAASSELDGMPHSVHRLEPFELASVPAFGLASDPASDLAFGFASVPASVLASDLASAPFDLDE